VVGGGCEAPSGPPAKATEQGVSQCPPMGLLGALVGRGRPHGGFSEHSLPSRSARPARKNTRRSPSFSQPRVHPSSPKNEQATRSPFLLSIKAP